MNITGIVTLSGKNATFGGFVRVITSKQNVTPKIRRGRTTDNWGTPRSILYNASGSVSGILEPSYWPAPDEWRGETGTLTWTLFNGRTVIYPLMVVAHSSAFGESKETVPEFTLAWMQTGPADYDGWPGNQPDSADPSKSNIQLWQDTLFTKDPNNLRSSAQVQWDIWGDIANTDADEADYLDDFISAAVAPFTYMKFRTGTFTRDSEDGGGTLTTMWGMQNTADEVIQPLQVNVDDDFHIGFEAKTLALNGTPATPGYVDAVKRRTGIDTLNDQVLRNWTEWGTRDLTEDIFLPRIYVRTDDNGLMSDVAVAYTWATTGSPPPDATADALLDLHDFTLPDGMIIQAREDRPIDRVNNLRIWIYGYRISTDAEAAAMFSDNFDVERIEESGTRGEVFDVGFGPAGSPSTPYDGLHPLVLRGTHRSTTSNPQLDKMLYEYGLYNTRDQRQAHSEFADDVYSTDGGIVDVTTEILVEDCNDTDVPGNLFNQKFTDLSGDANLVAIAVEKSDSPWRANFRITRRSDDFAVVEEALGTFQKPSMTDGSGVFVWIGDVIVTDVGAYVVLTESRVQVVRKRITLIRLRAPEGVDDVRDLPATGKVNDAPFLDFDALTLLYEGTSMRYNWALEDSARAVAVVSSFIYETYDGLPGHFWSNIPAERPIPTTEGLTEADIGTQHNASDINTAFVPQGPGTADFSALLS